MRITTKNMLIVTGILLVMVSISLPSETMLISNFATESKLAYKSEVRGMFFHSISMINPDWNLVAQTCADHGINLMVIEATGNNWAHYNSEIIPGGGDQLGPAITACHARGIKLHASMNVMMSAYKADGQQRRVVLPDGSTSNWLCPTKQASGDLVKAIVQEMATNYDIDGFMFDYVRYTTADMCFCEECHQKFVADTGLAGVNWRTDVVSGGRYRKEFMEWRVKPITELVRDIRTWMLAIKPDLEFSVASWTLFSDSPTYWRYWIGQDTADWIRNDYLDFVAPMAYTDSVVHTEGYIRDNGEYMTGGPEGKIPMVIFLDTCVDAVTTPEVFKQRVDKVRELGCDGWIIWRYGGPGDGAGSTAPDIRDYLSILDMPDVFSLENIQVYSNKTGAVITWTTDIPATSKVEYSTSPLFPASYQYSGAVDFHYWNLDHVEGSIIEDQTHVKEHYVSLLVLVPETEYYFRIQSEGSNVISSPVYTLFTGENGPLPEEPEEPVPEEPEASAPLEAPAVPTAPTVLPTPINTDFLVRPFFALVGLALVYLGSKKREY